MCDMLAFLYCIVLIDKELIVFLNWQPHLLLCGARASTHQEAGPYHQSQCYTPTHTNAGHKENQQLGNSHEQRNYP